MDLLKDRLAVRQLAFSLGTLLGQLFDGHVEEVIRLGALQTQRAVIFEAGAPVHQAVLQKVEQGFDVAAIAFPLVLLEMKKKQRFEIYLM